MALSNRVGHAVLASFLFFAFATQACSADAADDDSEESNVETAGAAVLAGRVSSAQEGPMEGVLVTAKKEGSPIAVTVVTDRDGRYEFPVNRLGAGRHIVTIRAIGYELARPTAIDVGRGGITTLDLSLAKVSDVRDDVAIDKKGHAWTGSMVTDRVQRLDPSSDEFTEYLLPRSTNIRRVFVDKHDGSGAMWVGSNHGASVVKIEPLD